MANRPSVAPADQKKATIEGPSAEEEDVWVQFPVSAGSMSYQRLEKMVVLLKWHSA